MRLWLASLVLAAAFPASASAQAVPQPGPDNPRLQTVRWNGSEEVWLTALPGTGLTVLLEPGDTVDRFQVADPTAMDVRVSAERDGLLIYPLRSGELGRLDVEAGGRVYRFSVRTGTDLLAAYLVRFQAGAPQLPLAIAAPSPPERGPANWSYRVRGDRIVAPTRISDDGRRTYIEFAPEIPLPAIFAIGPTGKEQLINGYMRGDTFVIDRVWNELVFRIDKEKATARRNAEEDARG
jgi:type IV secretion system protein VirB9